VVDPTSAAAIAAATLFASKAIEGAGSEAGKALTGAPGRLLDWIRRRGAEDPETGAALTLAQAKPEDQQRISQLAQVLEARAAADHGFAVELLDLVEATPEAKVLMSGAAYIGTVGGHANVTQVGRDQINIGLDPKR
jgi:hypothetical protein